MLQATIAGSGRALDEVLGYAPEDGPGRDLLARATGVNEYLLDVQEQWSQVQASGSPAEQLDFLHAAWPELLSIAQVASELRRELLDLCLITSSVPSRR